MAPSSRCPPDVGTPPCSVLHSSFSLCVYFPELLLTHTNESVLDVELVHNCWVNSLLLDNSFCVSHSHLKVSDFTISLQETPPHAEMEGLAQCLTSHSTGTAAVRGLLERKHIRIRTFGSYWLLVFLPKKATICFFSYIDYHHFEVVSGKCFPLEMEKPGRSKHNTSPVKK